jgi:TonB family protein
MSVLLDVTLRSSGILVVALVALAFMRRRSAALRHSVLAGAMAASAVVLPLSWVVPVWTVQVPAAMSAPVSVPLETSAVADATAVDAAESAQRPTLTTLMVTGWAIGVIVGAVMLALAFGQLRRIALRAVPVLDGPWSRGAADLAARVGLRRSVTLLQTDAPDVLATWGLIRPRILLPSHAHEWSDPRIQAVLGHEVAHIQRHDWAVQIAAEAIRAVYWFNPLFWLACRRLRRESEQACDDAVLSLGVPPRDYAMHLLGVARSCRTSSLPVAAVMPMARPSTLERRIAAMLNPSLGRQALSHWAVAVTVVGLLGFALPTAAFRVAQDGPLALSGVIYDPSGGVLPEAALTLEDERQNKWQATSDSTGRFEFPPVGAGKYVLEVSLAGFRALRQELELAVARDWARAVTLQVGTVQESITVREQRPKPKPGGPQAPGPVPIRVGGNIRPPTKTKDVHPVYPVSMREAGREGRVPLEAIIGRDGTVLSVRVATAQVHPDFAQAAIDAVQQWLFTPTMLNGKPVEVVMTVTVEFELED